MAQKATYIGTADKVKSLKVLVIDKLLTYQALYQFFKMKLAGLNQVRMRARMIAWKNQTGVSTSKDTYVYMSQSSTLLVDTKGHTYHVCVI